MDFMDATEVKEKVLKILDYFGMGGAKAAEAMGVTYATFRNKKNNRPGHSFNEKNYLDLVKFIKAKANEL
jgi:DNA repair ATPase RecN